MEKTTKPLTEPFPARLHVVFGTGPRYGVVFRRGPSSQVCTFLWDRQHDTFELGQWLKGRIYERRADLSPDGKYLIYFAMNGHWQSETKGSWTAISRAPWLKALALYAKGDCWEGGGLFLSNRRYWLNDRYFTREKILREVSEVHRDPSYQPEGDYGAEDTGVYYRRLLRDGWSMGEQINKGKWNSITIFDKPLSKGWTLRKMAHEQIGSPKGKGCYWDEHELIQQESKLRIPCPDWEWAELDRKTIVWAAQGGLYRAYIKSKSLMGEARLLQDFNALQFTAIKAPY